LKNQNFWEKRNVWKKKNFYERREFFLKIYKKEILGEKVIFGKKKDV
jgi:hypothetical protein